MAFLRESFDTVTVNFEKKSADDKKHVKLSSVRQRVKDLQLMQLEDFVSENQPGPQIKVQTTENYFFLFLNQNMLWVLKRTVSMRLFFWTLKTHV